MKEPLRVYTLILANFSVVDDDVHGFLQVKCWLLTVSGFISQSRLWITRRTKPSCSLPTPLGLSWLTTWSVTLRLVIHDFKRLILSSSRMILLGTASMWASNQWGLRPTLHDRDQLIFHRLWSLIFSMAMPPPRTPWSKVHVKGARLHTIQLSKLITECWYSVF